MNEAFLLKLNKFLEFVYGYISMPDLKVYEQKYVT